MPIIKISTIVDEDAWEELMQLARDSHEDISLVLSAAIRDYIHKHRVRPSVLKHLENSMQENTALGRLLDE